MNRIQKVEKCMGGKGTHLAYNLSLFGVENRTFGISFGQTGKEIIQILKESGSETKYLWYNEPETRTNYLVVDEQRNCTFLAESGTILPIDMTDKLLALMKRHIKHNEVLVIAGDASNVEDKDLPQKLLDMVKELDLKLYLDSSGEFMKKGIEYHPYMIKPNLEELSELAGNDVKSVEDVVSALDCLPDIPMIMVSMGKDGWVFRFDKKTYYGHGLSVSVGNTAGCGDALLSTLLYGFEHRKVRNVEEILSYATAISATCAMSNRTVGFDKELAKELTEQVVIEML